MRGSCRLQTLLALFFLLATTLSSADARLVLFDALALFESLAVVLTALQEDDADESDGDGEGHGGGGGLPRGGGGPP